MAAWDGVDIPEPEPGVWGYHQTWQRLAEAHRADLVVSSVPVPSQVTGFSVLRMAELRSVRAARGAWLDLSLPEVRSANLVFRLATQKGRPGSKPVLAV